MKTCLFTACYLEGEDDLGNNRFLRNLKYLHWYNGLKAQLGHESMVFLDNGSKLHHCMALQTAVPDIEFLRLSHIPRGKGSYNYPYLWRALYSARHWMADFGFDKIIFVDSDCYLLTERVTRYIRELESGWTTFWCQKYQFPAAEISVLCKDSFGLFQSFMDECPWENRDLTRPLELQLPFTEINKSFQCDRWGEDQVPQRPDMDIYCQARWNSQLVFLDA